MRLARSKKQVFCEAVHGIAKARLLKLMMQRKPKPVMAVGPTGAGKSTLLSALGLTEGGVKKTEAMVYLDKAIDTPGEMLAMPRYYNAIILNSNRAALVLFIVDAARKTRLAAKIALALKAPVLGVVTKIDLAGDKQIAEAEEALKHAGVKEITRVSAVSGEGIAELAQRLGLADAPGDASENVVG